MFVRPVFLVVLFWILSVPVRAFIRRIRFAGNIAELPKDDPGMAMAQADARATLPEFLRRLETPGVDLPSAAVKVPLTVPGGIEHVWINGIRIEGNEFVGRVDNQPHRTSGVKAGDTIRVRQAEISDWKLVENGQLVGGYTIRYLMKRMPARQRKAMLAG
ncbi:MAG TPA: DUF2314 domain-containing protein, partial [Gemmatimonadaceae bacterium]|nr:DUF2314 domain-containing protein [Gemmatimonadaceae bacterium]